jgi:hypothetical protein
MKNGIYKSENATYFIKDGKILMQMLGGMYKTTENFMQGKYVEPLKPDMEKSFNEVYSKVKSW